MRIFFSNGRAGFTLVEVLVVLVIISLLSAVVIANINRGDRGLQVRRSAQLISSALREAKNDALSGKRSGVYFTVGAHPIMFIDTDSDEQYDMGEEVRTVALDTDVLLSSLVPAGPLHVFFAPPNPDVFLNGVSGAEDALITVQSLADAAVSKTVRINILGLITVE